MDKYQEVKNNIIDMAVNTIVILMGTEISKSAFLNASHNIDTYKDRQLEKLEWFKHSSICLSKVQEITKITLEYIVVNATKIKDEDKLQKIVRELSKVYKVVELRK